MGIKLNDVQKAIKAIEMIDKLEEQLYNARLYVDRDEERLAKLGLVAAYRFAVDELRHIINKY